MREIGSKLIMNTSERRQWRWSGFFIVNFEQLSHSVLLSPLLTLNKYMSTGKGSFLAFLKYCKRS